MRIQLALVSTLVLAVVGQVPTAIFHGLGDSCYYPGMWEFTSEISELTGAYATCIEIGWGTVTSILESFDK